MKVFVPRAMEVRSGQEDHFPDMKMPVWDLVTASEVYPSSWLVFGFPGEVEKEQSGHIENGKGEKQEHGRGSVRYAKVKTEGSYLPELQVDLSGYCCCLLIGERQSVFLSQAGRQARLKLLSPVVWRWLGVGCKVAEGTKRFR